MDTAFFEGTRERRHHGPSVSELCFSKRKARSQEHSSSTLVILERKRSPNNRFTNPPYKRKSAIELMRLLFVPREAA
jgi:hypothetical protein